MLQVNGHLKVTLGLPSDMKFSEISPTIGKFEGIESGIVPRKPQTLGMIVECRPIEASPSILELTVPQSSFTSTIGMDMKIQSVDTNVKEILGYEPKDFIGSAMHDYLHPMDCAKMMPCRKMLQRTGYACSPIHRFMTSTGEWTWVQIEGTLRFKEGTREPHHLDMVVKIINQNEGKLKYIEQQEFYSKGKGDEDAVLIHPDPYNHFIPDKPLVETPEQLVAGLKEAEIPDSCIDIYLHCREMGMKHLPDNIEDIVSGEEEAVQLEAKNQKLCQKYDMENRVMKEKMNMITLSRKLKELEEKEEKASSLARNSTSYMSPPQCESIAPSPAPSSVSQPPSVSSATSFAPGSASSFENHMPSPYSVPSMVPSPHSVQSMVPSPHSVQSMVPSPHSVLSMVPSPQSVATTAPSLYVAPPNTQGLSSIAMDVRSPDSGIDSPTSAGSQSSPSENGTGTLQGSDVDIQYGLYMPEQIPFQPATSQFQNTAQASGVIPRPPFTQTTPYSFQPQATNVPSTFQFGTQQQQQMQQQTQQPLFTGQQNGTNFGTIDDGTLDMLLTNLTDPQQQQQQQQMAQQQQQQQQTLPQQHWVQKQQNLQQQIQQQQKLLQDLLQQQQHHQMQLPQQQHNQMQLPQQQQQQMQLPQQQATYDQQTSSFTSSPSPSSSVSSPPYPSDPTQPYSHTLGTSPLPPRMTSEGLTHASDDTTNLSLIGSVDFLSADTMNSTPSDLDSLQELWQQLQQ